MKRNKIFLIVGLLFVAVLVFLGIRNTYSATDRKYMITFNRLERNEILQICYTGADGKLDRSTCYGATSVDFYGLCYEWQSGRSKITRDEILNLTITNDMDLYCVPKQSFLGWTYVPKCFKCGEEYFWQIGGGGDTTPNHPEYGFPRTNVDSKTCVVVADITEKDKCKATPPENACYICDGKYTWTNNPGTNCQKQDNITSESYCKAPENACYICDGKYTWTNNPGTNCQKQDNITSESYCKAPENACYICDGKYTWTNNPGTNCQKQNNITSESYCKAPEVKKDNCYVCDGEFYWTDNAPSNNCILKEEIKDIANCRIVNPQTGNIAIFMVWVIGISSIIYAVVYFKGLKNEE